MTDLSFSLSTWTHWGYLLHRCPFSLLHLWYRKIEQLRMIQLVKWNILQIWSPFACFLLPRFYLWFFCIYFPWEKCETTGYSSSDIHLYIYSAVAWRFFISDLASARPFSFQRFMPALSYICFIMNTAVSGISPISYFQRNMWAYGFKVSSYSTWVFTVSYIFPDILGM